jgi:gamma-glutamylputrescine oxidase
MNPLYRNDKPGVFPPSWYAATADIPPQRPGLGGDARADVCVVGAGYTGLWAAWTLAQHGLKVIVLEAHRAGFGASGRNGGQVGSGYNKGQLWLEARLGPMKARALWDIAEGGKAQLRDFCRDHAPEARYLPGVAHGEYSRDEAAGVRAEVEHLAFAYGYKQIRVLDRDAMQDLVKTKRYQGGILDLGAGHIHPLRYVLALARVAEGAGVRICEGTEVTRVVKGQPAVVRTAQGNVTADHVILAGNGYLPDLHPAVSARVMPINSFIAATEPLGDRAATVLARDIAVADSKFVVNYYRLSEDGRFLFGGRENYSIGFPTDIAPALQTRMVQLFPQLRGVRVDYAWGGSLAVTTHRLPHVARIAPNILSGAGYSGHGVALSGMAGRVMAEAVIGQAGRLDIMSTLPVPAFPGGAAFRTPLLTLAMTWFSLRDRLGI